MYKNPGYLSPFQKSKVKDIAERFAGNNTNPLRMQVIGGGAGYAYNAVDIRNYFESANKNFDLIVR